MSEKPVIKLKISPDDRYAVVDLIHKFFLLVDSGHASETAALFSDDATLTFGLGSPNPGTIRGTAIGAAMRERELVVEFTTRHVISNIFLKIEEEGRIGAHYIITLFRASRESGTTIPGFVLDVDESYGQTQEGWRIIERTVTPVFSRQ